MSGEKLSIKFGIAGLSAADWNHRYHGCRQVNAIEGPPLMVAFDRGRSVAVLRGFPGNVRGRFLIGKRIMAKPKTSAHV
jgi:hypothetical protein